MAASRPPPQPFAAVCNRDLGAFTLYLITCIIHINFLGINDHYAVYSKVKCISPRWKPFAQSLHLGQDKIAIIESDVRKCESCMSEALNQWLQRNYNYKDNGAPSWRLVCIAVKEGGKNTALAEEIAREHLLATEVTREHLLAAEVASEIYVSHERNQSLLDKIYDLQIKFAGALMETKKAFDTHSKLLPDIIDYLITYNIVLLGPNRNKPALTQEVTKEFQLITTFRELFTILQHKYLSWFNYSLIIKLVDEFLKENFELKSTWSSYEKMLNDYFRNGGVQLKDAELVQFGDFNCPPTPNTKILIAKVDRDDLTLKDLFFFRRAIPKELNFSEYELFFSFVTIGSFHLEFWIPDFLYSVLRPLSTGQRQKLASIGVTELKCRPYEILFVFALHDTEKK